ncbi:MAG: transcription factor S [Candidatus Aenigmatarchaeota archaeon]
MVEFCKKCGNLMVVEKGKKKDYLICRKCGTKELLKGKVSIKEVKHETKKEVIVLKKEEGIAQLPKTKIMCPKCENMEAYWWMQQTRSADEPPTIFYKCTKCGYSWRSYG